VAASAMSGGRLFLRRRLRCESDIDLMCLFKHGTYRTYQGTGTYLSYRIPQERNRSRLILFSTRNLIWTFVNNECLSTVPQWKNFRLVGWQKILCDWTDLNS
jgi:hypothetical protein